MSPRPYLLLGDGDRRFIAQRVEAALAAWRGEWLADGAPECAPSAASVLRGERWLAAQAGEKPLLLLGCRGGWRAQLGALTVMEAPRQGVQGDPALAAKVCDT